MRTASRPATAPLLTPDQRMLDARARTGLAPTPSAAVLAMPSSSAPPGSPTAACRPLSSPRFPSAPGRRRNPGRKLGDPESRRRVLRGVLQGFAARQGNRLGFRAGRRSIGQYRDPDRRPVGGASKSPIVGKTPVAANRISRPLALAPVRMPRRPTSATPHLLRARRRKPVEKKLQVELRMVRLPSHRPRSGPRRVPLLIRKDIRQPQPAAPPARPHRATRRRAHHAGAPV